MFLVKDLTQASHFVGQSSTSSRGLIILVVLGAKSLVAQLIGLLFEEN